MLRCAKQLIATAVYKSPWFLISVVNIDGIRETRLTTLYPKTTFYFAVHVLTVNLLSTCVRVYKNTSIEKVF